MSRRAGMLLTAAALAVLWLAAGLRSVGEDRFAVLEGPGLGEGRLVATRWALAPPGLWRLTLWPRPAVELPLPVADEVRLPAADGSRYGFRGWITVRAQPERWRELQLASGGAGLAGVLAAAAREAATGLEVSSGTRELSEATAGRFERELGEALGRRGAELRHLDLDALDFLAVSDATAREALDTGAHLLVVGLDGADWAILDPLLAAGRLPNLRRLVEGGVRAKLRSISPLLSPVVWTSVATGVEPQRHGILDFLVAGDDGTSRQPVTSAQRRAPTFWELLSEQGIEVGVVGWWATWPADPVRGYLVSDRLAYQLFGYRADPDDARGKTWPPDLYEHLRPLVVEPSGVPLERVHEYLGAAPAPEAAGGERLEQMRTLLASGETYLEIADRLRRERMPRLEVVYFEGTDTVGHLFMEYRPPRRPGVSEADAARFGPVVDRYYETADRFLGRLLADRGAEWTVLVLSDHGFATDATRPHTTDPRIGHGPAADWHRRFGVLILSGANVRRGVRLDEAEIYDVAPTVLALFGQPVPHSWPGRVLGEALTAEFLEAHPVRQRLDEPLRLAPERRAADPAAADLVAKLESLGYVAPGGGAGATARSARNNAAVAHLAAGEYAEAEREIRAGIAEGGDGPMLRVNLGLALRFQGRRDEARPLLEQGLEHAATFRVAGDQLASLLLDLGDTAAAEGVARRVLEREPQAAEVWNTLGLVLERAGRDAEAAAAWRRAVDLDPDAALARNNLGNQARARGELDRAREWYERAIEADPYFMGAYNNLALVYERQGRVDRAEDLYQRALGKAPDHPIVLNNLAALYYARGDSTGARRVWTRLAESAPEYVSPLNNLAGLAIREGKLGEAEVLLGRALGLEPGYGDARINLSLIRSARREFDAARNELLRAIEDPRAARAAWVKLGELELARGRPEETRRAWRRALDIDPGQPALRRRLAALESQAGGAG